MPVVHLRSLALDGAAATAALPRIAEEVAAAAGCEPGDVWCTFQPLAAQAIGPRLVPGEGHIAYVDLWMRPRADDPSGPGRALEGACRAAATALAIPLADVWGALHPVEPGRVFAGGRLLG